MLEEIIPQSKYKSDTIPQDQKTQQQFACRNIPDYTVSELSVTYLRLFEQPIEMSTLLPMYTIQ